MGQLEWSVDGPRRAPLLGRSDVGFGLSRSASLAASCCRAQRSPGRSSAKVSCGYFGGEIQKTAVTSPRSHALEAINAEPAFQRSLNASKRLWCSANALRWVAGALVMLERSVTQAT